jgi:hypothetical protein
MPLCLMVIGIQEKDITNRVGHCDFGGGGGGGGGGLCLFLYLQIDVICSCLI